MITTISTTVLGSNKGAARIWLDGSKLSRAGFNIGDAFNVVENKLKRTLELVKTKQGSRPVMRKKRSWGDSPLIDINNQKLSALFGPIKMLKVVFVAGLIHISVHPAALAIEDRETRIKAVISEHLPFEIGSLAHGGGIMDHAVHTGLEKSGLQPSLAFALDMNKDYLDVSMRNNPIWKKTSLCIESRIEDADLSSLPKVNLLMAGLPCVGASAAGKAKNGHKFAENHETAGAFFHYFLKVADWVNPAVILLECVPGYYNTPSYSILSRTLERNGYKLTELKLNGRDFGAFEDRTRLVVVAVSKNLHFSGHIEKSTIRAATLGTLLDTEVKEDQYRPLPYLEKKEIADKAAGKGFRRQIVTAASPKVGVIGAGYARYRSSEPMIAHPTNNKLFRLLSVAEHARVKGIPAFLLEGVSATKAHEIAGQSVIWPLFAVIGEAIGKNLQITAAESAGIGLPLFEDQKTAGRSL